MRDCGDDWSSVVSSGTVQVYAPLPVHVYASSLPPTGSTSSEFSLTDRQSLARRLHAARARRTNQVPDRAEQGVESVVRQLAFIHVPYM